ncbi:PEP/pyruvate-binding domain-containing protein [Leeia oryzae]|uniref:PEP/pyruvate-binding domain-containing protein n=1 Tax=Leeia oryzae TaxID=356662 RepID=UPI00037C120C|nr:PEP/pyruvate-binding domain-containing protein [Leeia oryzae]
MNTTGLLDWQGVLVAPDAVGGKALSLARMARYGLPVPPGRVIVAGWSQRWVQDAGLEDAFAQAVTQCLAGDEAPLARVRQQLAATPLPAALIAHITTLLAEPDWLHAALAVRSSAIGEDGSKASFAGIYQTVLNVSGADQVLAAIRQVWLSLWTPTALAYRQRILGTQDVPGMGVVLMPLLPAKASGIAFTCDPITGRDDQLVIHAQWGLGESLVSGQSAGDEYHFVEDAYVDQLQPAARLRGSKTHKTIPAASGRTDTVATSAAEAAAEVLDASQALALAHLLHDAALALDFANPHFDLEWVWDGSQFWLTQARPVTRRPRYTYPQIAAQPACWTRGNTCEVVPDPLSALDWSNSRKLVNALLSQGLTMAGYPVLPGVQRAGIFHGRLYLELSIIQWEIFDGFGVSPTETNLLVGGHRAEIRVAPPSWRHKLKTGSYMLRYALKSPARRKRGLKAIDHSMQLAREWRQTPLPDVPADLHALLMQRLQEVRHHEDIFFLQGSGAASLSMLVQQMEKRFPGEGQSLTTALMAGGEPSVTARQGYALIELAHLAADDALAGPALRQGQLDQAFVQQLPSDNRFRLAYAQFLDQYGHRAIYETYFRNPRWREEPGYLLGALKDLAGVDLPALRQRQHTAAQQAEQRVRKAVSWPVWWMLRYLLGAARTECNQREAARSALMAHVEPSRHALLAIGRILVARQALDQPDDIFMLTTPEVFRALEGHIPAAGLLARVQDRQRLFADWQAVTPPDILMQDADLQLHATHHHADHLVTLTRADGQHYQGVPTGTGIGQGRVRLLRHPSEGHLLQPGEILVAPSTDPGWTPLFLKAGGLIVETGGYLSHGAIVAREFGIPAVVNLPGILGLLADGDRVEVNGVTGLVRRVPDGPVE